MFLPEDIDEARGRVFERELATSLASCMVTTWELSMESLLRMSIMPSTQREQQGILNSTVGKRLHRDEQITI